MYKVNLTIYRRELNTNNRRVVVHREKDVLHKAFKSVAMARNALKKYLANHDCQNGGEVDKKGSETYVKSLFFGNVELTSEYKIIKCD